jgi:hypothetical protein
MRIALLSLFLSLGFLLGCEESAPKQPPASTPPSQSATAEQKPAPAPAPAPSPVQETAKTASQPAETRETPPPGMVAQEADAGAGKETRGFGEGFIATPAETYFAARERILFRIQIPDFIRAYKFEHDMKGPKSHDEFMKQIIQKNNIQLPNLPVGQKYWYDAENETVNILRPKNQ